MQFHHLWIGNQLRITLDPRERNRAVFIRVCQNIEYTYREQSGKTTFSGKVKKGLVIFHNQMDFRCCFLTGFVETRQVCNAGCYLPHDCLNLSHNLLITLLPRNSAQPSQSIFSKTCLGYFSLFSGNWLRILLNGKMKITPSRPLLYQFRYWNSTSLEPHQWTCSW